MPPTISRRSVLAGATALPFLGVSGERAATSSTLTFGLSSYPPGIQPWTNAGRAAATVKLMIYRGLFLTADDLDQPGLEGAKRMCSPPPRILCTNRRAKAEVRCRVLVPAANRTCTVQGH
jgi:hypothetical protein